MIRNRDNDWVVMIRILDLLACQVFDGRGWVIGLGRGEYQLIF